jgi:hypothetical protein
MTVFTKRAIDVFNPVDGSGNARGADMGEARTWGTEVEQRLSPVLLTTDVGQFGAKGDGATDDTEALQDALDSAATSGLELLFPPGTFLISDTLRIPSNTRMRGAGIDITIIKMASSVGRGYHVLQTGDVDDPRSNIAISNLTVDCNIARWDVAEGDYGVGVNIAYTDHCWLTRVKCKDGYNHCFDIASSLPYDSTPLLYNDQPSRYIWVAECEASGAGDDQFATHQSSHIWFARCYAHDGGAINNNSNAFECDDGSRNVHFTDCIGARCHAGIQIKAHDSGPAPYNITVNNHRVINCINGVSIRHSGVGDGVLAMASDTLGVSDDNFSPTAFGIVINNLTVIAPTIPQPYIDNYTAEFFTEVTCVNIQNYTNVMISNAILTDGSEDIGNKEYADYDYVTGVMRLAVNCRRIVMNNITVSGFSDVDFGLTGTSTSGDTDGRIGLIVNGLVVRDGPKFPFAWNSANCDVYLNNYHITGNHSADGGIGVSFGGSNSVSVTRQSYCGVGQVLGYQTAVQWDSRQFTTPVMGMPVPMIFAEMDAAICVGAAANLPANAARIKSSATSTTAGLAIRSNAAGQRNATVYEDSSGNIVGLITIEGSRVNFHPTGNTAILWSAGSGSPEGSITASPGSKWIDTTSGIEYSKLSGSGNTGWVAVKNIGGILNMGSPVTLTIASGAVTIPRTTSYHFIDTEASAAADDLDTINGGVAGDVISVRSAASSRDVTLKHGTGNIQLAGAADKLLSNAADVAWLQYDATGAVWRQVSFADIL